MEGIKMVSGQPGPQGPYPMYQPVYQPVKSTSDTIKGLMFSNMMIALMVGAGLLLMWLGSLLWGFSDDSDVDDIGMFLRSLGMLLLVGMLLMTGLVRTDMNNWVRVVLILSATLMLIYIGFWAGFWGGTDLSDLMPYL